MLPERLRVAEELFPEFFLNNLPSPFCMRKNAVGAVLHARRQELKIARTGEQKQRAVTKEAGMPVVQVVAGQEFTFQVYEFLETHRLRHP
jgi:hypothetical protein